MDIDEPITVEPYNPGWVAEFKSESAVLCHALSIGSSRLEHIGSTALVGIHAKPIVDIMLGLSSLPPPAAIVAQMCSLGYEELGAAGVPGRLYFRKRAPTAFNVQAVLFRGRIWCDNLLLRDFLRLTPRKRGVTARRNSVSSRLATEHSLITLLPKRQLSQSCSLPHNDPTKALNKRGSATKPNEDQGRSAHLLGFQTCFLDL